MNSFDPRFDRRLYTPPHSHGVNLAPAAPRPRRRLPRRLVAAALDFAAGVVIGAAVLALLLHLKG